MNDQIEIAQHAAAAASIASKASYGVSLGTALTSAATAQWAGVGIGLLLGLATFWANWHWKRKDHEAKRAHEQRMVELQIAENEIRALGK